VELNGQRLSASNQAVLEFTGRVATGDMKLGAIARWFEENSLPTEDASKDRRSHASL
jgi:hypothetical protein